MPHNARPRCGARIGLNTGHTPARAQLRRIVSKKGRAAHRGAMPPPPTSSRPDGETARSRHESSDFQESAYEDEQTASARHVESLSQVAQSVVKLGEELIGEVPHQRQAGEAQPDKSQS